MNPINGFASAVEIHDRQTAPRAAPITPGITSGRNRRVSTFLNFQWEMADIVSTKPSEVWIEALAIAGCMPRVTSTDVAVTP